MAPIPQSMEFQGEAPSIPFASSLDSTGISILVALSLLSGLAIVGLLVAITVSLCNTRDSGYRSLFVRSHAFPYFLCLLLCWLLQSVGTGLSIQWIQDRVVSQGQLCVAQGALKHTADVGIAIWSTVMAIHAFCVSFLDLRMSKLVMMILLAAGWIIIFLFVGSGALLAGSVEAPFYGVVGQWCGVSKVSHQIVHVYVVMVFGAFLSIILCTLTFLRVRGNLVRDGWSISFQHTQRRSNDAATYAAQQILSYPITYAALFMPLAVVQFVKWSGKTITLEWIVFSNAVYLVSGLMTVIVFATSRQILPLASLRIGDRYLVPSSRGSSLAPSQDKAEKGDSKTVQFAAEATVIGSSPGRRQTKRPPAITIGNNRDSMASMYSAREGVYLAPLSSHWSPDTPPLPSRLSIA